MFASSKSVHKLIANKEQTIKRFKPTKSFLSCTLIAAGTGILASRFLQFELAEIFFSSLLIASLIAIILIAVSTSESRISSLLEKLWLNISTTFVNEPLNAQRNLSESLQESLNTLENEHRTLVISTNKKLEQAQRLFLVNSERLRQEARDSAVVEKLAPPRVRVVGSHNGSRGGYYGITPDTYYGEKYHRDIHFGEKFIMRTNSKNAREIVARSVTNLQFGLDELLLFTRAQHGGLLNRDFEPIFKTWHLKSLLSLARILANQTIERSDATDSVAIYSNIIKTHGPKALRFDDVFIYLETLQNLGLHSEFDSNFQNFRKVIDKPVQFGLLACNALVRKNGSVFEVSQEWTHELNNLYREDGLAELSVSATSGDLLDLIQVDAEAVLAGPLVSVIMPTYNGTQQIHTAINSILNQTWRQLELIIVDDGSDENEFRILKTICEAHEEITLIRLDLNQGAYPARNAGFRASRGEFITVHDDDDWSHPQKIQLQVEHLLANPEATGNMSYQSRIDESFSFLRINDNPEFNQRNYSSMMMRRELIESAGLWDEVNRGGDAEFHDRIEALTGKKIEGIVTAPVSFTRVRSNSLTAGEIRKGFIDYGRQTYALAYMNWHHELSSRSAKVTTLEASNRPYALPESLRPRLRRAHRGHFDLVYVTDLRFSGGNTSLVTAEIKAAVELGLHVAVAQLDSPTLRSRRPWDKKVQDLLAELRIPIISLDDDATASVLVLRHPTIMQYADRLTSNIVASRVYLVANNPPLGLGGVESVFDLKVCQDNASRAFGVCPIIAPESHQTRALCSAISPDANYAVANWPGFIDTESFAVDRDSQTWNTVPVVGRHSRDHRLKWPDTIEEISAAYLQPNSFSTSVLGGAASIMDLVPQSASNGLNVIEFGAMEPRDYLQSIDFWVYFHSEDWTESFGMAIAEAMAAGLVVVLPPYFEPMFGFGAIYASPREVADIVTQYWSDKKLYLAQGARARQIVRERYSVGSYQDKLRTLLDESTRPSESNVDMEPSK